MENKSKDATRVEEFVKLIKGEDTTAIAMGIQNPSIYKDFLNASSTEDKIRYGYAAGLITLDDLEWIEENMENLGLTSQQSSTDNGEE